VPGLKPGLRLLSFASFLPGTLNPIQNRLETNGSPDAAFLSTDADGAKWYIGNIPELVLGGAKGRQPSGVIVQRRHQTLHSA